MLEMSDKANEITTVCFLQGKIMFFVISVSVILTEFKTMFNFLLGKYLDIVQILCTL